MISHFGIFESPTAADYAMDVAVDNKNELAKLRFRLDTPEYFSTLEKKVLKVSVELAKARAVVTMLDNLECHSQELLMLKNACKNFDSVLLEYINAAY
jgi:hypothetical protein